MFVLLCSTDLWTLECLPTVGIVAETTVINCNFKDIQEIEIDAVSLTKVTEIMPIFKYDDTNSGDPRFSLKDPALGPSLQISDTKFSDEGEYLYRVVTDRGAKMVQLKITITGEIEFLQSHQKKKKNSEIHFVLKVVIIILSAFLTLIECFFPSIKPSTKIYSQAHGLKM